MDKYTYFSEKMYSYPENNFRETGLSGNGGSLLQNSARIAAGQTIRIACRTTLAGHRMSCAPEGRLFRTRGMRISPGPYRGWRDDRINAYICFGFSRKKSAKKQGRHG